MISMGYARNLVEGEGLTWSGGERVDGYSHFLWTLVIALLNPIPIPESKVGFAVAIVSSTLVVGTMFAVRAICASWRPGSLCLHQLAMALTGLLRSSIGRFAVARWGLPSC